MSDGIEQVGVGQIATNTEQRIIYVEPNDVYDKDADNAQKGLSLTPKYEDFCISFNLIIEAFSRFKSSCSANDKNGLKDKDGNKKTYSIQWGLTKEDMIKRRTSVLQGDRGKDTLNTSDGSYSYSDSDYNFLTTYYTDLTFDSYKEKTQIEGLGVESVQISYESWYTPTVVIKFVDVRGSALFGREEAVHVDEHLTAENIFGAFFTMPYPLFRLQVKGFMGRPVTYQLTCSNFRGEFNSQTGNFEAVATFIGYSWSLMTDIPFTYLVAAPYASYVGMEYWERHKATEDWALWDDDNISRQPLKLWEIFKSIKQADEKITSITSAATNEQNESIQTLTNEEKLLNDIRTHLSNFVKSLQTQVNSNFLGLYYDAESKNQQLLIFSDSPNLELSAETIKDYEDMYNSLTEYTSSYSDRGITTDKAPNKWNTCPKNITLLDKFVVTADNNGVVKDIKVKELTSLTINDLRNLVFNDKDGKLTHKTAEELYKAINEKHKDARVKKYVYLLDLYDVNTLINDRLNNMSKDKDEIIKKVNEEINFHITDIVGFKPYIGNVFKIIFCHLETFCHIMFDSAEEIYTQMKSGERNPSYLGVNVENTDIANNVNKNITPWPAIYDNGVKTEDCGYISETENVYGWVGDISHKFIEERVVYALQEGVQNIVDNFNDNSKAEKKLTFPILPYDYISGSSVFGAVGQTNISDLSGYLSIRAASLIGVMFGNNISVSDATLLGKIDALNFYSINPSVSALKSIIEDKTVANVKGISYCDIDSDVWAYGENKSNSNPKYHIFETANKILENYNKNGRDPMFKLENNTNLFVHWYDKKEIGYVPSSLKMFDLYKSDFDYDSKTDTEKPCFVPKLYNEQNGVVKSHEWLYNCDSSKLSVITNDNCEKYINKSMFSVIDDSSLVNSIINRYEQIKVGDCKVLDYDIKEDLSPIYDKALKVSKSHTSKFFKNVCYMLSANLTKLKSVLIQYNVNISSLSPIESTFLYDGWNHKIYKDFNNEVKVNDGGDLILNNEAITINDLVVQQFKINYFANKGYQGDECNLFGCPFYYMQNTKKSGESQEEYRDRVLKVKALLFLHTFKYNYILTDLNVFKKDKRYGGLEAVPKGYLLFLGGMLWRRRYGQKHGDPITYENTDYEEASFVKPDINHTLFIKYTEKNNSSYNLFSTIIKIKDGPTYNYPISNLFGGNEVIDYNIENQLISLFEKFALGKFTSIASKYEIPGGVTRGVIKNFYNLIYTKERLESTFESTLKYLGAEDWIKNYATINVDTNKSSTYQGLKMLMKEDATSQQLFKDLYMGNYIVCDSCNKRLTQSKANVQNSDRINVNNDLFDAYISGFLNGAKDIVTATSQDIGGGSDIYISDKMIKNRDLSVAIYYYLKNLWDKWLVIADSNAFDVGTYFKQNFIFTDSFYRNTYNKLAVNCQKLATNWIQLADNGSLFHFLSAIVKDHNCIFLPVPDYVGFNGETQKHDIEMMEDLFRPLPYNSIEAPSNSNKFVIIYTYPSSTKDGDNGYKTDTYDIWSHTEGFTEEARRYFKITNAEDFERNKDIATREGYNVPSFGISFGRQNNHIFKNLRVTMDNPVMTEQSIKALWHVAQMGSGGGRKVNFIGQDTFNVFSNYSYTVEVEMMGNAQICPLMYFQLMNIPMWRGTYMIYKVTHNMTPGDMTTTVAAMKMSKYCKPFNSTFFVYNPYAQTEAERNKLSNDCDTTDNGTSTSPNVYNGTYGSAGMFTNKTDAEKFRMCGIDNMKIGPAEAMSRGLITNVTFNQTGGTKTLQMNKYVAEDFKAICNEILALGFFKLNVGNCYRNYNSPNLKGISRHCWGLAVDINPGGGGNPWFATHIPTDFPEPAQGSAPPWSVKKCPYGGVYDRSRCIWHWQHPVVQIFRAHGWNWGGKYGDVMHFSLDGH